MNDERHMTNDEPRTTNGGDHRDECYSMTIIGMMLMSVLLMIIMTMLMVLVVMMMMTMMLMLILILIVIPP